MIKIGGRAGFEILADLESNFRDIDFPIELALPWKYIELWKPLADRIETIIAFFKNSLYSCSARTDQ
ncbi:MAG: hypothetical protein JXB88_19730 [Spirochaetales bacterium]|nr:hypothetical protein [Spirochaetales bacterium]